MNEQSKHTLQPSASYASHVDGATPGALQPQEPHATLPVQQSPSAPADLPGTPQLVRDQDGLALVHNNMVLRADLTPMISRLRQDKLHAEMLVKAAKLKGFQGTPIAVDATAGLGEDSLLLAAAGFEVHLFERDPVIAALLQDALLRASQDPALAVTVAHMHLQQADSIQALRALDFQPDVILLDPMFPAKRKDASSKKKMQLFQQLEKPCQDEEELLAAALSADPRKVVVKRPLKGPYLAGKKPSYSLKGKTVRYDCIVLPR